MGGVEEKKSRVIWSAANEKRLMELWENRLADIRREKKTGPIYSAMAKDLSSYGKSFSGKDVQVKIQNLTRRYKKEKAAINPLSESLPSWPYYNKLHEIIGDLITEKPCERAFGSIDHLLIGSSSSQGPTIEPCSVPSPSSSVQSVPPLPSRSVPSPLPSPLPIDSTPPPSPASSLSCLSDDLSAPVKPKKVKNTVFQNKILDMYNALNDNIQENLEKMYKNDKELIKIEREKAETLKEMKNDAKELKEALISFLKK